MNVCIVRPPVHLGDDGQSGFDRAEMLVNALRQLSSMVSLSS